MKKFYKLKLDDGGRNKSKRPSQINDCVVRTFSIVSGLPYDEVYDTMAKAGRKPSDGFHSSAWLMRRRGKEVFGGFFNRIDVKNTTAMTFPEKYPIGRFVLETDGHTWAVINGVAHDLWRIKPQTKKLVGGWQYIKNEQN
jgi:hypothetical protein